MSKNAIMTKFTGALHRTGFKLKKHSPELLIAAGIIGVVGSVVTACTATVKATKVVETAKESIEEIHDTAEKGVTKAGEEYTVEDSQKDLTTVYAKTGVEIVKLYAPAVILGALSLTAIIASNRIQRKRNVALAAAYATIDKGFKQYQNNVIERFGDKVHKELKYNIKNKEVEETVTDENGEVKVVKKHVAVVDPEQFYSPYSKIFDELNDYYEDNAELNLLFLRAQQAHANDLLKSRGPGGRLFLNEVYDMLGFERTKAGQRVGWINNGDDDPVGDGYVDFGIYNIYNPSARKFVNGYEPAIILDFNVDGDIWEDM